MKITNTDNPLFPGHVVLEKEPGEPVWKFEQDVEKFMQNGYEQSPDAANTEWGKRVVVRPRARS